MRVSELTLDSYSQGILHYAMLLMAEKNSHPRTQLYQGLWFATEFPTISNFSLVIKHIHRQTTSQCHNSTVIFWKLAWDGSWSLWIDDQACQSYHMLAFISHLFFTSNPHANFFFFFLFLAALSSSLSCTWTGDKERKSWHSTNLFIQKLSCDWWGAMNWKEAVFSGTLSTSSKIPWKSVRIKDF